MDVSVRRVRELKEKDCFILKFVEKPLPSDVWIREGYISSRKKYLCFRFDDLMIWDYFDPYLSVIQVYPVKNDIER